MRDRRVPRCRTSSRRHHAFPWDQILLKPVPHEPHWSPKSRCLCRRTTRCRAGPTRTRLGLPLAEQILLHSPWKASDRIYTLRNVADLLIPTLSTGLKRATTTGTPWSTLDSPDQLEAFLETREAEVMRDEPTRRSPRTSRTTKVSSSRRRPARQGRSTLRRGRGDRMDDPIC